MITVQQKEMKCKLKYNWQYCLIYIVLRMQIVIYSMCCNTGVFFCACVFACVTCMHGYLGWMRAVYVCRKLHPPKKTKKNKKKHNKTCGNASKTASKINPMLVVIFFSKNSCIFDRKLREYVSLT